ncbi:MAG: ferredoxin, partial [Cyanobacteria bacterium P01_H01_bin.35]
MPNTYTVKIHHQGQTHTVEVPGDKTILEVAE